jgi:hypothetical protein
LGIDGAGVRDFKSSPRSSRGQNMAVTKSSLAGWLTNAAGQEHRLMKPKRSVVAASHPFAPDGPSSSSVPGRWTLSLVLATQRACRGFAAKSRACSAYGR